jgi:hypothetical protein
VLYYCGNENGHLVKYKFCIIYIEIINIVYRSESYSIDDVTEWLRWLIANQLHSMHACSNHAVVDAKILFTIAYYYAPARLTSQVIVESCRGW